MIEESPCLISDRYTDLPKELVSHLGYFLNYPSLMAARTINKNWNNILVKPEYPILSTNDASLLKQFFCHTSLVIPEFKELKLKKINIQFEPETHNHNHMLKVTFRSKLVEYDNGVEKDARAPKEFNLDFQKIYKYLELAKLKYRNESHIQYSALNNDDKKIFLHILQTAPNNSGAQRLTLAQDKTSLLIKQSNASLKLMQEDLQQQTEMLPEEKTKNLYVINKVLEQAYYVHNTHYLTITERRQRDYFIRYYLNLPQSSSNTDYCLRCKVLSNQNLGDLKRLKQSLRRYRDPNGKFLQAIQEVEQAIMNLCKTETFQKNDQKIKTNKI